MTTARLVARCVLFLVLCHLVPSVLHSQTRDTAMVFPERQNSFIGLRSRPRLSGIVSLGAGSFNGFQSDGRYGNFFQPTIGFDFLAEPGGSFHLLLGGRLGASDPLTTEVLFGLRQPFGIGDEESINVFGDLGLLFFSDDTKESAVNTGVRAVFGVHTYGSLDMEYRLAGEFRGSSARIEDNNHDRTLWWVGAEVGVAFSLVTTKWQPTHKDSVLAAMKYIATDEELEAMINASSTSRLDDLVDRFWRRRNITPDSRTNEARREYDRRVEAANGAFSRPRKLGVSTDPGRILALYGAPDEIEGARSSYNDRYIYQLWVYRHRIGGQAMAVFLFLDDEPREWRQIFSNAPGEVSGVLPSDLPATMTRWIQ